MGGLLNECLPCPLADELEKDIRQSLAAALLPQRRQVALGNQAPLVQQANPVPNWVAVPTTGSTPVAARGDAYLLEGVLRRQKGAHRLCPYFPKIVTTDTDITRFAGRESVILGRLTGVGRREVRP